ncbi:MAG: transcriptional regulator [Actinomycetia bacterium]|nr:transcriptional regulator [Actinomycetes bacterium]
MTCEEAAERLECSPSKISRMETGRVSIHPRDVRDLLELYGADEEQCAALLVIAREARERGWWHSFFGVLPKLYLTFIGLEAEATLVRTYEPQLIPGLLQTEAYARALRSRYPFRRDPEETDSFIAARMARQNHLTRDEPLNLWAILDEAVIRRMVGGTGIMRDQLRHVLEVGMLPNVTIQVIPFAAGAHPAMEGSFTILEFSDPADPQLVYLENLMSSLYLEQEKEITWYRLVFDHALATALSPEDTRKLITEAVLGLE